MGSTTRGRWLRSVHRFDQPLVRDEQRQPEYPGNPSRPQPDRSRYGLHSPDDLVLDDGVRARRDPRREHADAPLVFRMLLEDALLQILIRHALVGARITLPHELRQRDGAVALLQLRFRDGLDIGDQNRLITRWFGRRWWCGLG